MKTSPATILREYGPFPGVTAVHGVTYDGRNVWFASGDKINALDPASGEIPRSLSAPAQSGTAFDGTHLYQIADNQIHKIDPASGKVVATIPAPGNGNNSGMAWAEGSLWVGEYRAGKIHQIDPATGKLLRSIQSQRFVTGVTWLGGELWHGTWDKDESALCRIDAATGEMLESLEMPAGTGVSGLEADGQETFYCGGGTSGKVRAVKR